VGIFLITVIDVPPSNSFTVCCAHDHGRAPRAQRRRRRGLLRVGGALPRSDQPAPPAICSIYDPRFWWIERIWKLHPIHFMHIFDGTPFKSVIWRLIGVRIGRRLFDDGVLHLRADPDCLGDECVFNYLSMIQCDSQEDGTYKSGRTTLGAGCTIGVSAFVHYGVTMGDGSVLAADSFLMKERMFRPGARWGGNPAREM